MLVKLKIGAKVIKQRTCGCCMRKQHFIAMV